MKHLGGGNHFVRTRCAAEEDPRPGQPADHPAFSEDGHVLQETGLEQDAAGLFGQADADVYPRSPGYVPHEYVRRKPGERLFRVRLQDGQASPEIDIASQGATIEEARENLREALTLFFETASPKEIQTRLHDEVYVTRVEVAVG
jgi:hypothetical protein